MSEEGIHSMQLTPDYIVGLVDGEGSFTVYIRNPEDSRERVRRVRAEAKFYVKLIERDKAILDRLREFFGCGNIYLQKDRRKNHQQCYRFEVSSRADLKQKIIPFFRAHTLRFASKAHDFKIFCELFEMLEQNKHLKVEGIARMYQLKQGMH